MRFWNYSLFSMQTKNNLEVKNNSIYSMVFYLLNFSNVISKPCEYTTFIIE